MRSGFSDTKPGSASALEDKVNATECMHCPCSCKAYGSDMLHGRKIVKMRPPFCILPPALTDVVIEISLLSQKYIFRSQHMLMSVFHAIKSVLRTRRSQIKSVIIPFEADFTVKFSGYYLMIHLAWFEHINLFDHLTYLSNQLTQVPPSKATSDAWGSILLTTENTSCNQHDTNDSLFCIDSEHQTKLKLMFSK